MENRQKIPVPRRSFLWSLNETSGEIHTHIGPTEFTPSANDRIVRANDRGGYEQAAMEARPFVLAREGAYVLLANPTADTSRLNGEYVPGGNKERDLSLGTTKIIPGPCAFPLWPGQSAEVRPAHKLGANHYLLVEVVGPIDEDAPYTELVMKSARLSSVVIDAPDSAGNTSSSASEDAAELERSPAMTLRIGQRIVIQGRHTSLFIPPTGIAVVPAVEDGPADAEVSSDDAIAGLSVAIREELTALVARVEGGMTSKQFSTMKNELRHRSSLSLGERAVMLTALDEAWGARATTSHKSSRRDHRRHPHQPPMDPYARKAVVLGPKNFCILFDADGNPRIVKGPARVFPGPHDTFLQRGSRRRVYDAYELGTNQALWLRIISPISKAELSSRLPAGHTLEQDHYPAGAELLVRGEPTVFFPFIEAEVLHPETGEPHVGNDHDAVIIDAIGVEPKSGVYVRDKATGKVRLVRGEVSILVDPRKEEPVKRRVPAKDWNLWIARSAPELQVAAEVSTPWALSVIVPTNHAAQVRSRAGRRVIVGPAVELLEYEEQLTKIELSKGAHKDGRQTKSTAYLRVRGGRFRDRFEVVSKDLTRFAVSVGISAHFEGDPERWFASEDPVKLVAMTLRGRIRELPATALFSELAPKVKASVFAEGEALSFPEIGAILDGVDLLGIELADQKLAAAFAAAHKGAVELELQDRQAERRLISVKLRDAVDVEEHAVQRQSHERMANTARAELEDQHRIELRKLELESAREQADASGRAEKERIAVEARLSLAQAETEARAKRKLRDAEIEAEARKLVDAVVLDTHRAQAEIDRATAAALAEADSRRLEAVQPELVGALHAAADAEVMKAAAENMNLVSLLGGKSPVELFTRLLEGSPLARTVWSMKDRAAGRPSPSPTPSSEGPGGDGNEAEPKGRATSD
ncbi:hypothetical protein PPSIR1_21869 [Plesiocystis pacifica SIR-1]|uniref:Uncharacterized protein n=1 Tax=Plesiocystis pacifica SIR-1 TaxID=391625 RepID=A6FXM1_9BACT|nr:hypothetical protein [Plesiocystis pacifica]EDM81609.1 hypothetical protein PPSIR1_21869 [Plesiocystis pacifica SIR-1]